jgi:4-hydroxy-2-oxoheptanedioate aldolase
MKNRTNKMKQTLAEGKVALGSCLDTHSPSVVEIAGYSGLDFVRIDTEYSWRRDESFEHMMRAAALAEVTPLVRVQKSAPYLISEALQAGALAILVSDIETPSEAEAVVKAAKYEPRGRRGYSSFSFSAKWGTAGGREWVEWCDHELLVGVMVENTKIMDHLDDIFAMDGIDYCLFGPSDYAMSLGYRGPKKGDSAIIDALQKTCEIGRKHNVAVGFGIGRPWKENSERWIRMGCRILELGHDLSLLNAAWKEAVSEIIT